MLMKGINVPADVFLALVRIYKQHKPVDQLTPEERDIWLRAHQLEARAQGAVARSKGHKP